MHGLRKKNKTSLHMAAVGSLSASVVMLYRGGVGVFVTVWRMVVL